MLTLVTGYNNKILKEFYDKESTEYKYWMPYVQEHPSIQSEFGRKLANRCKDKDVVIITHSDHILNGIRLAVCLDSASCSIIYYDKEEKEILIQVKENGNLSHWPKGFFDQIEQDLSKLVKERRLKIGKEEKVEKRCPFCGGISYTHKDPIGFLCTECNHIWDYTEEPNSYRQIK